MYVQYKIVLFYVSTGPLNKETKDRDPSLGSFTLLNLNLNLSF